MLGWLSTNSTIVIAIASAVSAATAVIVMLATIVNVAINRRLAAENRALRKAGSDPQVVAYATINPRVFAAIDFVLANIGKGPARNVSYKIISGEADLVKKGVRLLPEGITYAFLPQDDQLSSSMGMGWDLLEEPKVAPFEVEVSYQNLAGDQRTGTFKIDVVQFEGLRRLGQPADEQIAEHLKKMAAAVESWSHRRLQVETMSVTERRAHDEQIRRMIQERQASRNGDKNE